MKIFTRNEIWDSLENAEFYWVNNELSEKQKGFHYEFWQWLGNNFAITQDQNFNVVFNDDQLTDMFFLRFSS